MRGPVVGRKNYYGSGALWSGEFTATLFSLFHTLELWQINPHTWLTEYLSACAAAGRHGSGRLSSASCPGTASRGNHRAPRRRRRCAARPATGAATPRCLTVARYCGREFSVQEMELIRSIIAEDPSRYRLAISRVVCERLDWRRLNGELKDMSCRVAMLRMHRDGLIRLPAPQGGCYNGRRRRRRTPQAEPQLPLTGSVHELPELCLLPVTARGGLTVVVRVRGPLPLPGLHPAGGSPAALSGDQRAAGVSGPGLCRFGLEDRSPRSVHRLEPGSTRGPLAPRASTTPAS